MREEKTPKPKIPVQVEAFERCTVRKCTEHRMWQEDLDNKISGPPSTKVVGCTQHATMNADKCLFQETKRSQIKATTVACDC